MARRARGGRVGDYEHEVLIGAVPGGVLVPLPPWAKELAARRRRNSPAISLTPKLRWRNNPPAFSQKRVSTFLRARDFKMLGGSKFRLRQGFACGKTLVRRVRAAPSAMGPRPKLVRSHYGAWLSQPMHPVRNWREAQGPPLQKQRNHSELCRRGGACPSRRPPPYKA